MIDRYGNPGQAFSLRQLMDRMLEDAFVMPRNGGETWGGPAVDVYEEGDNLVVEAHLPGTKPENLDVTVERGVLTISGTAESEQERKDRNYLLREKRSGRFSRSLQLPSTYTADPTEASFEHGMLRLVFAKAAEARPRRIEVGTGKQAAISGQASPSQPAEGTSSRRRS